MTTTNGPTSHFRFTTHDELRRLRVRERDSMARKVRQGEAAGISEARLRFMRTKLAAMNAKLNEEA